MQNIAQSISKESSDMASSLESRYQKLIDVPLSHRIRKSLVHLFNYFDIYGPRITHLYAVMTYFRFFQLIGAAFLAENSNVFLPGTLAYKTMSILTVLFHLVPAKYRDGHEELVIYIINLILIGFGIYLTATAFVYDKTTKVSRITTNVLTVFIAIGPFLFIPILIQFFGQLFSAILVSNEQMKLHTLIAIILSIANYFVYLWVLMGAYSKTLLFRPCSFQTAESMPQIRLFSAVCSITFLLSMTANFSKWVSQGCALASIILYVYGATTCFNCGTFTQSHHQTMVLGGSIIGILLCLSSMYQILTDYRWQESFFPFFALISFIVLFLTNIYIKNRSKKDLITLDEFRETQEMSVFKPPGNFKRVVLTGFAHCHEACMDFSVYKVAVQEWPSRVDIWATYAKYAAIYPEHSHSLIFIAQNLQAQKLNNAAVDALMDGIKVTLKTRETLITPELKIQLSKLTKVFNRAKARIRNFWDLVLQGNTFEMNHAIISAYKSVELSEHEVSHLMNLYPNNRFVARQMALYCLDIKSDNIGYKTWMNNISLIRRGHLIQQDVMHNLGVDSFPNIPEHCDESESMKISPSDPEIDTNNDFADENVDLNIDATEIIGAQIDKHQIPAIKYMKITTIICFCLLIFIPSIVSLISFNGRINKMIEPLHYMKGIAYARNLLNMLPAFLGKFYLEEVNDPKNPSRKLMNRYRLKQGFRMESFGNFNTTRSIMVYLASEASTAIEMMSGLAHYEVGNSLIEQVRTKIFSSIVQYYYFTAVKTYSVSNITAQQTLAIIANHVGNAATKNTITIQDMEGPDSLTVRINFILPSWSMSDSLKILTTYLRQLDERNTKLFTISSTIVVVLIVIVYTVSLVLQIKKLRSNKMEIFKVLTTLPKTAVSTVSASFKSIKNSSTSSMSTTNSDTEMSRQEESIIKLFSSISDGSSTNAESFFIFVTIVLIAVGVLGTARSTFCFTDAFKIVVQNCHHINYLFGSVCYMFGIMSDLFQLIPVYYDDAFKNTAPSVDVLKSEIKRLIPNQISTLHNLFLGGSAKQDIPYIGIQEATISASEILSCDVEAPPVDVIESAHCFSAPGQIYLYVAMIRRIAAQMSLEKDPHYPTPRGDGIAQLWQIGPIEIYEAFIYPASEKLIPLIEDRVANQKIHLKVDMALVIVAGFILTCVVLYLIKKEDEYMKFTLKLLLRCPANIVLTNQRIMDLISGDYNVKTEDSTLRTLQFHNEVVNKLNDVVIVVNDEDGKIASVNTSFEEMFEVSSKDVVGTNVYEFFKNPSFEFQGNNKSFKAVTNLIYTKDNEKIYLEFTTSQVSSRRIFSARDQTQNIMHEKMIEDERKKSDAMLASILPPMLVTRVQAGEKNISFSVQSASILFLDIVEFTPWCGNHDAQYVMRMLNTIFKEFDAITNSKRTMTKIKCIGDCYMAAGGIFEEINQPAIHAKEVVEFGCQSIRKLREINEKENESLRIRVGINTGGPIVAGVIGVEKPTFEILGPAINIAHEMEHHGVPMKVHISRPVYELIYGQQFDIKERGEIDVKGTKMFTYIVEP